MRELVLSKKFTPVYFIVGILAVILFRAIELSALEIFMLTFSCFLVGIISFLQNFVFKNKE